MSRQTGKSPALPGNEPRLGGGTIRSLQRGLEVLDMIADRGRMSLTAVAAHAGLNLSTTHHIIKTLRDLGYVTQTAEREYRLGVSVYKLAGAAWKGDDLGKIATPCWPTWHCGRRKRRTCRFLTAGRLSSSSVALK